MRERFSSAAVVLNIVQCLRALDRNDEAEEILADLSIKMPGNRYVLVESATIASARGDFEEASRRWAVVRKRIPLLAAGYTSGVEVERRLGREAEADQILVQAVTYLKSDLGIHLEYARSAQRRGDWTSALERWALVRERFSECDEAREQEAVAVAVVDTQAGPGDLRPSSA
jgi:predicted Zn-dependent protease